MGRDREAVVHEVGWPLQSAHCSDPAGLPNFPEADKAFQVGSRPRGRRLEPSFAVAVTPRRRRFCLCRAPCPTRPR